MRDDLHFLIETLAGPPDMDQEIWLTYWQARARLRLLALDAYKRMTSLAIEQGYSGYLCDDAYKHVAQDISGPMKEINEFINIENLE